MDVPVPDSLAWALHVINAISLIVIADSFNHFRIWKTTLTYDISPGPRKTGSTFLTPGADLLEV
jgi:hypothetical protein